MGTSILAPQKMPTAANSIVGWHVVGAAVRVTIPPAWLAAYAAARAAAEQRFRERWWARNRPSLN